MGDVSNDDREVQFTRAERKQLRALCSDQRATTGLRSRSVLEVFSPPRIAPCSEKLGLQSVGSLDLRTGWDFRKEEDRKKAKALVRREQPWMVFLEPPCAEFSPLKKLFAHTSKEYPVALADKRREAMGHLAFCLEIALIQVQAGRRFALEHPNGADSWDTRGVDMVSRLPGVEQVVFDQMPLRPQRGPGDPVEEIH